MSKTKETFKAGEFSPEEFQRRILQVLREYYRLEYVKRGGDQVFAYSKPKKVEFMIERVKEPSSAIEYETLEYVAPGEGKDQTAFQIYFHKNGANQIAVIFQLPKSPTDDPKAADPKFVALVITA